MKPTLHPPWTEADRQAAAYGFGLWAFLASETLFFGGLLFAYAVLRWSDPEGVAAGARETELVLGVVNTAILLTSSLLVAIAERLTEAGERALARRMIGGAILLGIVFLAVKAAEYALDIRHDLWPADQASFALAGGARRFWGFYWVATGVHAVHVVAGLGLLARLAVLPGKTAASLASMRATALFWHFIDIVWVALFGLIYLPGRP